MIILKCPFQSFFWVELVGDLHDGAVLQLSCYLNSETVKGVLNVLHTTGHYEETLALLDKKVNKVACNYITDLYCRLCCLA